MKMLMTGGSGRLGFEMQHLLPNIIAPSSKEIDVRNQKSIVSAIEKYSPELLIHAAAYTDVSGAEKNLSDCWERNVEGTRNIVAALSNSACDSVKKLVYISTDYVFSGNEGNYSEADALGPALNFYALSKLVAERHVLGTKKSLVIRTSFRPKEWNYPKAFSDMFTSQDYVDIIAKEIALIFGQINNVNTDVIHIATERKSVFELASRRAPQVDEAKKSSVKVKLPHDISLDCSKWLAFKENSEGSLKLGAE